MADIPVAIEIQTAVTGMESLDVITKKLLQLRAAMTAGIREGVTSITQPLREFQRATTIDAAKMPKSFLEQFSFNELISTLPKVKKELNMTETAFSSLLSTGTKNQIIDALSNIGFGIERLNPSVADFNKMLLKGQPVTAAQSQKMLELAYTIRASSPIYTAHKAALDQIIVGLEGVNTAVAKNMALQKAVIPVQQFGTEKTAAAAATLRLVSSAAQGALMASSLLTGSFMGLAFGLIFLQFSIHNIALMAFALGASFIFVTGILQNLTKFVKNFALMLPVVNREMGKLEITTTKLWMKFGKGVVSPIGKDIAGLLKSVKGLVEEFMSYFTAAVKAAGISKLIGLIVTDLSLIIQEMGPILKVMATSLIIPLTLLLAVLKVITGVFARWTMLLRWADENASWLATALRSLATTIAVVANIIIGLLITKGLIMMVKWLAINIAMIIKKIFTLELLTKATIKNTIAIGGNTRVTALNTAVHTTWLRVLGIGTAVVTGFKWAIHALTAGILILSVALSLPVWAIVAIIAAIIALIVLIVIYRKQIAEFFTGIYADIKNFFVESFKLWTMKKEDIPTDENQRIMKAGLIPDMTVIGPALSAAAFWFISDFVTKFIMPITSSMSTFFSDLGTSSSSFFVDNFVTPFLSVVDVSLNMPLVAKFNDIKQSIATALGEETWAELGTSVSNFFRDKFAVPFGTFVVDKFVAPIVTIIQTFRNTLSTLLGSEFWSVLGHNISVFMQQNLVAPIKSKFADVLEAIQSWLIQLSQIETAFGWRPFAGAEFAATGMQAGIDKLRASIADVKNLTTKNIPSLLPSVADYKDLLEANKLIIKQSMGIAPVNPYDQTQGKTTEITVNINGDVINERQIKDLAFKGVEEALGARGGRLNTFTPGP